MNISITIHADCAKIVPSIPAIIIIYVNTRKKTIFSQPRGKRRKPLKDRTHISR